MGKSHKKINSGSQSVDYQSSHSRNILGIKKKTSRRKIRHNNSLCDEDNILSTKYTKNKVKDHWASAYTGKQGNISNMPLFGETLEDKLKCEPVELYTRNYSGNYYVSYDTGKWNNNGTTEEVLDKIIFQLTNDITYIYPYDVEFWKATQKQLNRRGTASRFYGHYREKIKI